MSIGRHGRPVEGRLVDVGARGLRLASGGGAPGAGTRVGLEILLDDPGRPDGPPRVVLDGRGRIVWVRGGAGDDAEVHAGVCFDAPVDVRRSFPDVTVY